MSPELISTPGGLRERGAAHQSDEPGKQYHLAPHVYACHAEGSIVFLDARHDRYFGVGGKDVAQLTRLVVELRDYRPDSVSADESLPSPAQPSAWIARLLAQGLLCTGEIGGSPRRRKTLPAPEIDPMLTSSAQPPPVRLSDMLNFAVACVRAAWSLRWLSVGSIASRVDSARSNDAHFDSGQVLPLVARFRRLRCWSFSEKNRCLFNALALIYFLQRYGHFPHFVIGVKTTPFAAHAWVQTDQVLLDGNPASVGHFTPILVA